MVALTLVCEYIDAVFSYCHVLTLHVCISRAVGADVAVTDRPTYTVLVNDVGYFFFLVTADCFHDNS